MADPAQTQAKQPLAIVKLNKKISEMTDEERRAFADDMFDTLKARHTAAKDIAAGKG